MSLSSDGNTVAIGAEKNDGVIDFGTTSGSNSGHVRVYSRSLTNVNGCDSTSILNLTIINSTTGPPETQSSCDSLVWNGKTYTSSGTYTDTLINAAGCDSVVTLNLTINNSTATTDIQSHCGSYTWIDGNTYTASNNTATYTLTNTAGCDSVVILNLTVFEDSSVTNITACDSFVWNGTTYTLSLIHI